MSKLVKRYAILFSTVFTVAIITSYVANSMGYQLGYTIGEWDCETGQNNFDGGLLLETY
jgi:hypothetical protein